MRLFWQKPFVFLALTLIMTTFTNKTMYFHVSPHEHDDVFQRCRLRLLEDPTNQRLSFDVCKRPGGAVQCCAHQARFPRRGYSKHCTIQMRACIIWLFGDSTVSRFLFGSIDAFAPCPKGATAEAVRMWKRFSTARKHLFSQPFPSTAEGLRLWSGYGTATASAKNCRYQHVTRCKFWIGFLHTPSHFLYKKSGDLNTKKIFFFLCSTSAPTNALKSHLWCCVQETILIF